MPELLAILDDIWMRNGPLLNFLYPHAPPTYPGRMSTSKSSTTCAVATPPAFACRFRPTCCRAGSIW